MTRNNPSAIQVSVAALTTEIDGDVDTTIHPDTAAALAALVDTWGESGATYDTRVENSAKLLERIRRESSVRAFVLERTLVVENVEDAYRVTRIS